MLLLLLLLMLLWFCWILVSSNSFCRVIACSTRLSAASSSRPRPKLLLPLLMSAAGGDAVRQELPAAVDFALALAILFKATRAASTMVNAASPGKSTDTTTPMLTLMTEL
jgi:hypothetical protein